MQLLLRITMSDPGAANVSQRNLFALNRGTADIFDESGTSHHLDGFDGERAYAKFSRAQNFYESDAARP